MKRIKVYKDIIEVTDIIKEISNLLDSPLPNEGFNYFDMNISDVEYEDEDHIKHFCGEAIVRALKSLNFQPIDGSSYRFFKNSYVIGFVVDYNSGKATVQRQS